MFMIGLLFMTMCRLYFYYVMSSQLNCLKKHVCINVLFSVSLNDLILFPFLLVTLFIGYTCPCAIARAGHWSRNNEALLVLFL